MEKEKYEDDDPLQEAVEKLAWNGLVELDSAMRGAGFDKTHVHDSLDVESVEGWGTYIGLDNPHSNFEKIADNLTEEKIEKISTIISEYGDLIDDYRDRLGGNAKPDPNSWTLKDMVLFSAIAFTHAAAEKVCDYRNARSVLNGEAVDYVDNKSNFFQTNMLEEYKYEILKDLHDSFDTSHPMHLDVEKKEHTTKQETKKT